MNSHKWAIVLATLGAILLLVGILFGWRYSLKDLLGIDRTVRDAAIALWAFLLPAWFTFEEWWAPQDATQLATFRKNQQYARYGWTAAGGVIAILIGLGAPETQRTDVGPNKNAAPPVSPQPPR